MTEMHWSFDKLRMSVGGDGKSIREL